VSTIRGKERTCFVLEEHWIHWTDEPGYQVLSVQDLYLVPARRVTATQAAKFGSFLNFSPLQGRNKEK
jgi:hypothetical protein